MSRLAESLQSVYCFLRAPFQLSGALVVGTGAPRSTRNNGGGGRSTRRAWLLGDERGADGERWLVRGQELTIVEGAAPTVNLN